MDVRRREYTLLVGSVLSVWSTVDAVYRTFNMYTDMAYNVHTMRIARVTLDREVKVESTPTSSSASTSTTSSAPSVAMGTIVGLLIDKGLVDAVLKELKKKQTTADSEYLQPATTTATITNPAIEYPTLAPTINTYPDTNNNNDIGGLEYKYNQHYESEQLNPFQLLEFDKQLTLSKMNIFEQGLGYMTKYIIQDQYSRHTFIIYSTLLHIFAICYMLQVLNPEIISEIDHMNQHTNI